MKYLLIILLSILQCSYTFAANRYIYSDNNIKITLEWEKDTNSDSQIVIITMKPLINILIPDHEGCFSFSRFNAIMGSFMNYNCPVYDIYETGKDYCYIEKDSIITYEWKVPYSSPIKAFFFDIMYVPTGTYDYEDKMKKKRLIQHTNANGKKVIAIRASDIGSLIRNPYLEIAP